MQHKNVCLELVDGHTEFTDHGIVQLFTSPHPQRACKPTKYVSPNAPHIHPKNIRPAFTIETKSDSTEASDYASLSPYILNTVRQEILHLTKFCIF